MLLDTVYSAVVLSMVWYSTLVTVDGRLMETTCRWEKGRPFSQNVQCLLERHRRQAQPDYNVYGHPCMNYVSLVQPERRVGNTIDQLTGSAICDRTLKRRWYRFQGPAGGAMPQTCIEEFNCGTHAPIWLNGDHPALYGEVLDLPVCVSLSGDCCERTWYIRVANCGEFFTYLLTDTPGCFMAYCAGRQDPCPPGQSSITGFSPGCSDNFPELSGGVELHIGEHGHEVAVYCDYTGPIPAGSVIETEWFVNGEQTGEADTGKFPVFVDSMRGRRRSVLQEGHWMGKMGSNIYCRMRGRWYNRTGVPSPYLHSEKHFAGITISDRVVEVSESEPETVIQIQATMPVACLPQFSEACKITVELSHDPELGGKKCIDGSMEQVVFGDCSVDITPENWRRPHNVTVKAVRDFYRDGNKNMRVDFKPIFSTTSSPLWDNYKLPDVEVVAKDVEKALCSSTGDPHYNTFDGLYYHVYLEGEFVLYKHTHMPIQINTRLEECGKTVSCNCAVAVKAADDVIVIDRCKRRNRNLAFGSSFPEGWRSLHRHALEQGESFVDGLKLYEYDNGRRYTVHLPTGAYVDFKVGEHWINIYLYGSSDDWRSTLGLCGTFNDDRDDDMTFPDGVTRVHASPYEACGDSEAVCKFAEAWRVSKEDSFFGEVIEVPVEDHEFFSEKKYCKCEKKDGQSTVKCNYHYDVMNCQGERMKQVGVDKTDDVKIRARSESERHKRSITSTWSDDVIDYFQEEFVYNASFKGKVPNWPTPTGITESYARRHCDDVITRSRASHVCNNIIRDKLEMLIDECMTDIKVTGDLTWALASLTTMTEECQNSIHDDPQYWQTPQETEPDQYSYENSHGAALLTNVCPGDCSLKGTCYQGKCTCIHGYEGTDCTTSTFAIAQIHHVSEDGLCDHHARPCNKVKVHGSGFRETADRYCGFENEDGDISYTTATSVTFEEQFCTLPQTDVTMGDVTKRPALQRYVMTLLQNGIQSNSRPFVMFDRRCYECVARDGEIICTRDLHSCVVAGICYGAGERDPLDCCQTCDPDVSTEGFTTATVSSPISLFPRQTTYSTQQGSSWKLTVRAFGGSGCNFQYIPSTNGADPFVHVTSGRSLQTRIGGDLIGQFELLVTAVDPCGVNISRAYYVTITPRPPTEAPPTVDVKQNCQGNQSPVYPEVSSVHVILVHGVLTLHMNATDPDGDDVEYYVKKHSDNYVTMSKDGYLRYHAGDNVMRDTLTAEAEDTCGNKARHNVVINIIKCTCANGGTCLVDSDVMTSHRGYVCSCASGYTGENCEVNIE